MAYGQCADLPKKQVRRGLGCLGGRRPEVGQIDLQALPESPDSSVGLPEIRVVWGTARSLRWDLAMGSRWHATSLQALK